MISDAYREQNAELHRIQMHWGCGAATYIDIVHDLIRCVGTKDILDYGCGKGTLQDALGFPIHEYDPAIPGKTDTPEPADIVVCACVLEHIEPEFLDDVLADLKRCIKRVGLFIIPHEQAIDGGWHLSAHPRDWWDTKLESVGLVIHSAITVQSIVSTYEGGTMLGNRTFYLVKHAETTTA